MIARLYRMALLASPKRHRDLYAAEMIDAFERELGRRHSAGWWAQVKFATTAIIDLLATGIAERRRRHVVRFGYFFSALDFTLAWRMLLRYPGLSSVGVFGMAVGIALAAGAFAIITAIVEVRLPLPQGERVVSVISTNLSLSGHEWRMVHDYARWRNATSVTDLSLSHQITRNLILEDRAPEPVTVVEISPSAFRVAGMEAYRGRHLLDDDARMGADEVVVIGYDEWLRRFEADPNIIGRTVRLGATTHTIVGVMPEGFAFPVNHSFWIPWRNDPAVYQPLTGPHVTVFGRLAPHATIETANAEFVEFGRRLAADSPATHAQLRPLVIPYTYAYNDMGDPENYLSMRAIELTMALVLILVCVNVAILVYARTATRQGEIAVRGALGASRKRIVAQLFVEALVLAGVAALIGVSLISVALPLLEGEMRSIIGGRLPFWMHFRIAGDDVTYLVALTLLAAAIVGVLPAVKATGLNVQARLQTLSSGGGSRMQMGPLWTLLIVTQVAVTVTVLPAAMYFTWESLRVRSGGAGFASGEVLSATLTLERSSEPATAADDTAFRSRFATQHAQLDEALRANAAFVDVTFSMESPGQERTMTLEAEHQPLPENPADYNITEGSKAGHLARYNRVATNFFDTFGVPLLLGRGFTRADLGTEHVIINRTVADAVFGGANPLGRRIKYVGRGREAAGSDAMPMERWFEIIGVVPDFPDDEFVPDPILYHPAAYGDVYPASIGVRTRASDPATYSNTLRDIAADVNPTLQLRDLTTNAAAATQELGMFRMIGVTVGLVMLSVIILSAAGIYALMSFTVAKRRREIGIRAALGADRNRLLAGIFSRVFGQLAIGAAIGMVGAFGVQQLLEGELFHGQGALILPVVALVMIVTGLLAAIGPARQGLSIQPTEALRED
jgi:putative ABC transport system permease protein